MKKFLIKFLIFSVLLFIAISSYILLSADKGTDPFYRRFTVESKHSLILGSSRAAQGIEPEILNRKLKLEKEIYNYAFTLSPAKWGPPYLNSIKKKLKESNKTDNIFLLECNPWSFVSSKNQIGEFPEQNAIPNTIFFPNMNPNFEYFFGGYQYLNLQILISKLLGKNSSYVNESGRLVVELKYDSSQINNRIARKIEIYQAKQKDELLDSVRFKYLQETVNFLSKRGFVYLVRLPVSNQMLKLEEDLMPNFDNEMKKVENSTYINLITLSNDYITSDGNHIHNLFSRSITEVLADSIRASAF